MQAGHSFAHYSVVEKIGAGGMGEVFRAHDTKLRRDVALKVLPLEVAADPDRMARFEREARTLASLQHTNVAAIFGLETAEGRTFLVMELVEGEDLAQRVAKGPLPVAEALEVAVQIAAGLEAAHDGGIVHRDLKPANIMLTPDGQVKILDFGLARAYQGETTVEQDISNSPTLTAAMTGDGIILGTAAYMSPEQARGQNVDRRSDIWAFGSLLFELLSGVRAFPGDTVSDIVASVLKSDPPWDTLPADVPRPLQRLLRRCLEKDPRRRLHDIADARIEIEDLIDGRSLLPDRPAESAPTRHAVGRRWAWPVAAVVLLAAGLFAGGQLLAPPPAPPAPPLRMTLQADDFVPRSATALARDGSAFVYPGRAETAVWQLMIRRLDQFGNTRLPGTEYGMNPFFSPDGDWVGFSREGRVGKLPATGGPIQPLCELKGEITGHWANDGYIYISGRWDEAGRMPAICRIPEGGGTPETLVTTTNTDESFFDPFLLPDGKTLLFSGVFRGERIEALDISSGRRTVLVEGGSWPTPTDDNRLMYYETRSDRILCMAFDAGSLTVSGSPTVLVDQVTAFSLAPTGRVVYAPASISNDDIVVQVTPDGTWTPLLEEAGSWAQPRFSPDGRSLLLRKTASPNCILWRYDLTRRVLSRVTFTGDVHDAVLSPDGQWLAFCSADINARALTVMPADGSRPAWALHPGDSPQSTPDWSPDGTHLIYTQDSPTTGPDLWVAAAGDTTQAPQPFLQTPFAEDFPRFSPDGNWVAYTSDESGREEIYLRPFPGPGGKIQVSREGGNGAMWAPDGRRLFYAFGDRFMVVDVEEGDRLKVGSPREQFSGEFAFERAANYDIAPDGESFVIVRSADQNEGRTGFNVITNALPALDQR